MKQQPLLTEDECESPHTARGWHIFADPRAFSLVCSLTHRSSICYWISTFSFSKSWPRHICTSGLKGTCRLPVSLELGACSHLFLRVPGYPLQWSLFLFEFFSVSLRAFLLTVLLLTKRISDPPQRTQTVRSIDFLPIVFP